MVEVSSALVEQPVDHTRARRARLVLNLIALFLLVASWLLPRNSPQLLSVGVVTALLSFAPVLLLVKAQFGAALKFNLAAPAWGSPSLGPALGGALVGPILPALTNYQPLDPVGVWPYAAALGSVVLLAILAVDADQRRFLRVLVLLTVCAIYGFGAACDINGAFDFKQREVHRAEVLSKRISKGRHTSYYVTPVPWETRMERHELDVDRFVWQRLLVGRPAEVQIGRGMLGLPWVSHIEAAQ